MATATQRRSYTFDAEMRLKDAGLVAADAAATVGGSAKIITVGDATFRGVVVVDVTALEVATGDENYRIIVQGSESSTFASGIHNLAELTLGTARPGGAAASAVGRFEIPFINEQNGTVFPYLRLYTDVTGTIATGINYAAYIGRDAL